MARLNWTDQAIDDLNKIAAYIAIDSPKYAEIHIGRLRERARQLIAASRSGRIVPELGQEEIRELIVGNYRIIYLLVNPNQVDILTVHHAARLLRKKNLGLEE